mgnify:CR=1 FL=1
MRGSTFRPGEVSGTGEVHPLTPNPSPPRGEGDHTPWLVFADDWGRHPSSCQHLVRHLLPRVPVTWVNTIGTRPPRLDRATAARVAGKLRDWCSPKPTSSTNTEPSPRVVAPKMWPSFGSSPTRWLNRTLLGRSLRPLIESLPEPPVVVTTLPLVADLVGRIPAKRWVYYCVDDFSAWPGYDGPTMLRMERELVPNMDTVIAVSDTLVSHVAGLGKTAHLLTHGVDTDFWQAEATPPPNPLPEAERGNLTVFTGLAPPFVVFWGVIDRRMDTEFVRRVAETIAGTVVLIGPQEDPDPALLAIPRVAVRPPVPFAELPAVAAAADVLVMPYADLPVTRAIQPLKLKEYLATGKPTVVRDLPATREWADTCDVVATADEFAARVRDRIADGLPAGQQAARQRLADESWAGKAALFEKWVTGE